MASLCRLYQSQQCMSKRQFSIATNRSDCGFHLRARNALFLGCLLRISSNPMSPDDEENTAFITPHGLYCYKVMPFGLKNAGATYQRLMTKIFKPLIGHTVECWQFLGFMVSQRGIEVSPDQVKAVMETPPPRNKKELQGFTGKLVALGRFIARFTDELRPFFLAIRKAGAHGWTDNCQNTFEKIKHCLTQPTHLKQPHSKRKIVYVSGGIRMGNQRRSIPLPLTQGAETYLLRQQALLDTQPTPRIKRTKWWTLRVDGASRSSGSGVGLLLQSPTGEHLEQAIRLGSPASNNEAEYKAILSGLDLALALSVSKLRIYSDSQLVVKHVQEEYEAKDARMARYLAKLPPSHQEAILLPIHVQTSPSVTETSTCNTIEGNPSKRPGMDGQYCKISPDRHSNPGDPKQAHKIRVQAARFTLIGGHLYKRSFTGPYLRCLEHSETQYVLAELHEGICGNHVGGRSLAHRAHSQGYYWPTMKKDAAAYVKKCYKCQRYAPIPHMPSATLKTVSGPWPFAQWGMDIVGPLPTAPAQKKFLLVATDYFSKWVEAEAYASIKDKDVTKFVWKNIVCHFRIPQAIITDNGPQFDSIAFRNFCSELNIRNSYSTPRYPQSNGQAEATNKTLITALKKGLNKPKGNGSKSYPASYGPTEPNTRTANRKYSFALAYGMDAVIPTEIGLPTIRTEAAKQNDANTEIGRNLDWADEVRESAAIRMADYQQRVSAHYNRKVKPRSFKNAAIAEDEGVHPLVFGSPLQVPPSLQQTPVLAFLFALLSAAASLLFASFQ
ncbi:Pro-Pol polyprotein [Vitis vinifera]|uniref:Pro-Pol polyprotein n=1 Tax=Vitis vinifera TaxID=29760 RepID=A0A438DI28_VITVI|nr:Pro-Pol polyprotein [Vitis vinifera]